MDGANNVYYRKYQGLVILPVVGFSEVGGVTV